MNATSGDLLADDLSGDGRKDSTERPAGEGPSVAKLVSADTVRSGLLAIVSLIAAETLRRFEAPTWFLVLTIVLCLGVAVAMKWVVATKRRRIALAVVATTYLVLLVWGIATRPPRFVITSRFAYFSVSPRDDAAALWQANNADNKHCEKFLVDMYLAIQLESVQERPTVVTDLRVDIGVEGSGWIPFGDRLFSRWTPTERLSHEATYLVRPDATFQISIESFDRQLREKALRRHEPVFGWLLLQLPRENGRRYNVSRMRVTIADSGGSNSVDLMFHGGPLQPAEFKLLKPADISACRVVGPRALIKVPTAE